MSFEVVSVTEFPQTPFHYLTAEALGENLFKDCPVLGGILSDLKHIWHAKGPYLEVRNIATGRKVGSWRFGGVLRDSNTQIVAVDELKRVYGRMSLLVVGLNCSLSGGLLCIFNIFASKVLRVVHIEEQITNIHVIDSACDITVLPETSPLKYFDGIAGIGTLGGNVFLLDLCKQICENAIQNMDISVRDEVNPCQMVILQKKKISDIKKYVGRSVERDEHLAIHLNVVTNPSTEHFSLKGEDGEDRVYVNSSEAEVSALFYSHQLASLLVGYNFGAFQMWNLASIDLLYTSPICDGNIPVTHFTVQEPADDPKAYCYVWVSYSHNLLFHSGLPYAVMYSFYFDNKKFISGYGNLYEDFQHCSIRFQLELGETQSSASSAPVKGGTCLGLQCINKCPNKKDLNSLALCLISWLTWDCEEEVNTAILLFDLNQWYKEQMPRMPNWSNCSNYIIKNRLNECLLDIKIDQKTLSQFMGIQRLEEHFCPTSLSFDLLGINEGSIMKICNKSLQKVFLDQIISDSHLALIRPENLCKQIVALGLVPLFCDIQINNALDINYQREILLNVVLEQHLVGWLCQTASQLANNAYISSGLSIYSLLTWAFQRAVALKTACDNYCVPLFDYSGTKLDDNTITLIFCGTNQIRSLCSFYRYVSSKLLTFVSDKEGLLEEERSLENVVAYFEVLLWMVHIGLLPEYQAREGVGSLLGTPYLIHDLTAYYNKKRVQLQIASRETFIEKDCLLFIDNLINCKGAAETLRQQWQEDGGSGLYPPPSLQSVLRTYLLNGPDIAFKHSLVTYTLLDIAMTVDEHNKVIKLLLKFPQIFDLTQSTIKIVQAFWHLDHDDYETALETILDPCVLLEDFHHWHHSLMMRSLLLQDQAGLALLYFQIRKPSMQDDKDLLTVISLLIRKNMLDEAFKFRLQNRGPNDQALLTHIFNECNKNELLHTLLYRRLSDQEEKAFFKYLEETRNARCEDLKLFYYILRSRFLEAFDSYSATKRRLPDTQGLIGQRDATIADNVVKMFKSLLPDVNKNLVELVRKERTNLWREVEKPTPLSVFVHSANDQVQYKSSVIFAALAKAKQTFNDSMDNTKVKHDVITEDTPFLRTPVVLKKKPSANTPLLKPKVIEQNEQGEEDLGPSPCKKLKLSPRISKTSPLKSTNLSKLSTPIIKRKRLSLETSDSTIVLPQSILKSVSRTILDDSIFDENTSINTSLQMECENSIRRSRLGLTSRKPVRTPLKSHVKFDDVRYSGSSTEQNSSKEITSRQSKDSTSSIADDVFYSPDHSFEAGKIEESLGKSVFRSKERLIFDETLQDHQEIQDNTPPSTEEQCPVSDVNNPQLAVEESTLSTKRMSFQSPRSRKSYKRSFGDSPLPVHSSPRLARKTLELPPVETQTVLAPDLDVATSSLMSTPSQKLKGRKSLSRTLLENNAFSILKSNNLLEESKSFAKKSVLSSLNSTSVYMDSDVEMNDTFNASLEAFLDKYKDIENSINKSETELVSKTTEFKSVETRRESLRKGVTGALVSANESKDEYQSKKVEVFGEQDETLDETSDTHEEVNVYEDLSSASEDVREILKNIKEDEKPDAGISYSTSMYQTERKELEMPDDILEVEENSNSNGNIEAQNSYYDNINIVEPASNEISDMDKAFIHNEEIIEIASSSEDNSGDGSSASNSYSGPSTNKSFSSNESVRGSYISNENSNASYLSNRSEEGESFDQDGDTLERFSMREVQADINILKHSDDKKVPEMQEEIEIGGQPVLVETDEEHMDSLLVTNQDDILEEESLIKEPENKLTEKQSISVQCTLGATQFDLDESQVPSEEISDIVEKLEEHPRRSVGLQVTLKIHEDDKTNDKGGTPLRLRTVKKTYPGRRALSQSGEVEASPKLAVALTKRTYARKPSNIKLFEDGEAEVLKENKEANVIVEKDSIEEHVGEQVELGKNSNKSTEEQMDSPNKLEVQVLDDPIAPTSSNDIENISTSKSKEFENNSKSFSSIELFEDKETEAVKKDKKTDLIVKEINITKEYVGEQVELGKSSNKSTEVLKDSANKLEVQVLDDHKPPTTSSNDIEKTSPSKSEEYENNSGSSSIVTRSRSILLSQKDTSSTSISEESLATDSKSSKGNYEQSETSSSSRSSARIRGKSRLLSESLFDKTILAESPEKWDVMDTSLISQTPQVGQSDDKSKKRRGTNSELDRTEAFEEQDVMDTSLISHKLEEESKQNRRHTRKLLSDIDDPGNITLEGEEKVKGQEPSDTKASLLKAYYAKQSSKPSIIEDQNQTINVKPARARRTRSASVNHALSSNTRKRSIRSKSIDLDNEQFTQSGELKIILDPIGEVPGPSTSNEVPKSRSRAASHFGDYTTSRRLTRRQASMLEAINNVEQEVKLMPLLDNIEPLDLLDKPDFHGQADPDESKLHEHGSVSSSSETLSRHARSASVLSDVPGTPTKRKGKAKLIHVDSPSSGIKARLRKQSTDTISIASEHSGSPSPPKKSKKKGKDNEHETEDDSSPKKTVPKGRSRASSVSSLKSDTSDISVRTTRSRRIQSAKSELPEIQEEKGSEEGATHATTKKRGRKRKE